MKNKKTVKILFALLIMLFFVLISKSFSSVDAATFGPDILEAYLMSGNWTAYCREHGKALGGNIGGNPINALEYNQDSGMQHIEPATGYALYCGASGDSLQRVIWYSKVWTGGGNAVVDADSGVAGINPRFKAYGDVYYGIIAPYKSMGGSNKNLFTITDDTKDENVKVMVNQQKKKYIVGPYKLKLNPSVPKYNVSSETITNPTLETKQALIEELKSEDKNSGEQKDESYYENLAESIMNNTENSEHLNMDNLFNNGVYNVSNDAKMELYNELLNWKRINKPFAKFESNKCLEGINGDPNSFKFLDSNGNQIEFPDFINEKEFYIEFTPNNDGNIQYVGTPVIKIEWLDDFYYNVNGAWSVVSAKANGVPTEYSVTSSQSTSYNSSECRFTKTEQISVPVHVGASGAVVAYLTGTLNYVSKFGKKHYSEREVPDGKDENGNPKTRTERYFDGYDRVGEYWKLDESTSTTSWSYTWGSSYFQRIDGVITQTTGGDSTGHWSEVYSNLAINKLCNIEIGGTVWLESPDNKTANIDGKLGTGDKPFAGIQVQLYDVTQGNTAVVGGNGDQGKLIAVTTTDKNGHYRFFGTNDKINGSYADALGQKHSMRELLLNPLHKYYVTFVYNGQLYQPTYYHKQLTSPGYSNAKDMSREEFNAKFTRIDSDTANYKSPETNAWNRAAWNRAYSAKHKLKDKDGNFIQYEDSALTYEDVWKKFLEFATHTYSNTYGHNYSSEPKDEDAKEEWGSQGDTIVWQRYQNGEKYETYKVTWGGTHYGDVLQVKLKNWLINEGVTFNEARDVIRFIEDSMMVATTLQENKTYPFDTNKFENYCIDNIEKPENKTINIGKAGSYKYLYSQDSDQSRWVDFGLTQREVADLALGKDLYRVTMLVNGKKETYDYNKKNLNDDGVWEINTRASDTLFNGTDFYNRPVRSSEYLFDQSDSYGGADIKNLQVWVTYKILIKNQGTVDIDLNNTEIVDYYDASQYTFDGDLNGNTYTPKTYNEYSYKDSNNGNVYRHYINSYIGKDGKGGRLENTYYENNKDSKDTIGTSLKVSTEGSGQERNPVHEEIKGGNYDYNTLYLTGLKTTDGQTTLGVGKYSYAYITFKVNNDPNTNRIKLDQDINSSSLTIGKRNIAEVNAYSTKYTSAQSIPDNLDGYTRISVSGKVAGLIDTDSNPGSLSTKDLDNDGNIIIDGNDEVRNRIEDDTDKSPNLKITIDNSNIRKFKGMVYEDNRTETSGKSKIGNGLYDKNETKINGVTMQLVELVQNVDENGFSTGTYSGEKVWASYQYGNDLKVEPSRNYNRYSSGTNSSKVILSGPGVLTVNASGLSENQGEYEFDSIPAGDFYIRFVYGDTTETTLTKGSNDVNNLVGSSVDSLSGKNAKSYNGQDYKSTVYQSGINQSSDDMNFNSIKGFTDYSKQNYAKVDDVDKVKDGNVQMVVHDKDSDFQSQSLKIPGKDQMYYYGINQSNTNGNPSDAKDVYDYREITNRYSSNNNVDDDGKAETIDDNGVLNNKAEILSSFEKLATRQKVTKDGSQQQDESDDSLKTRQIEMIRNFMNNTRMVAQTGIINIEIEKDNQNLSTDDVEKNGNEYKNLKEYVIENIDLGLVERPRAQLKLNKQVTNFKIVLANQQVLFNANKAVKNLVYSKHSGHKVNYEGLRLNSVENNTKESPELITAYMDDELLEGAKMQVEYTLTVTNVGEVDYTDNQYYYTGQTKGGNISSTNAVNVIDYHSNSLKFDGNDNTQWHVKTVDELQPNNQTNNYIVNGRYTNELKTYDTLIVTEDLGNGSGANNGLLPEKSKLGDDKSSKSTKLILTSELSADTTGGNLIFNNLAEIVATTNAQGRRMQFSIVGNQEMADQSLGNNASITGESGDDLITPSEIDADSAQKIVIMPPTGENKNYIPIIVGSIIGAIVIVGAVVLIRKYTKKQ